MFGIPMGTNCASLLADLFLYSYENEFLDLLADLFLYSCENEFLDELLKEGKESLLEGLISHIITLMTLSLSITEDF